MTTFAEQRILDNNARFSATELSRTINYDGADIQAFIVEGEHRAKLTSNVLANEMTITVKKTAISTTAKGTPVIVEGEEWQVWAKVSGTTLNTTLSLTKDGAPIFRRR